jgi:ribokinase
VPRPGRVLVVGSINVDLTVTADRLPGPGETVTGGTYARHAGGKGANQAVAAARAGAQVALVGAVGDDDLGRAAIAQLAEEDVDTSAVLTVEGETTGVALIAVDAQGQNQIVVASGANAHVDAQAGLARVPPAQDVLLLQFELPAAVVDAAAAVACERGWTVVCDPAPPRELGAALLRAKPILTPNAGEACALTGTDDPHDAVRMLHERTGAPAIVTRGDQPVLVCDEAGVREVPAPHVDAVDSTGAGDAFAGVLAALLAEERPLDEAIAVAVAGASHSTAVHGAREGMRTRRELEALAEDLREGRC